MAYRPPYKSPVIVIGKNVMITRTHRQTVKENIRTSHSRALCASGWSSRECTDVSGRLTKLPSPLPLEVCLLQVAELGNLV